MAPVSGRLRFHFRIIPAAGSALLSWLMLVPLFVVVFPVIYRMEVLMVDQIVDRKTVAIPGPVGDITPQARQARDEAERASEAAKTSEKQARAYAQQAGERSDTATAKLIGDSASKTRTALDSWYGDLLARRSILVSVGDSYMAGFRTSNPATSSMARRCADALGLECRNYAVAGSGMLGGTGDRFKVQLDHAASALAADLGRVSVVLIGGGRNDGSVASQAGYQEAVRSTLQHAVDLFPGAHVVFVPAMWDASWPSNDLRHVYAKAMEAAVLVPAVQAVRGAWSWGIADPGYMDIHPGDELSGIFGQLMASAILHGGDTVWRDRELALTAGGSNVEQFGGTAVLSHGVLHARIRANRPQAQGANLICRIEHAATLGVWTTFVGLTDDNLVWQGKFDGRDFSRIGDIFGVPGDHKNYNAQIVYHPLVTV